MREVQSTPSPEDIATGPLDEAASLAANLAHLVRRFETETHGLQNKLSDAREALLRAREVGTASILELRRLRDDVWLARAAEEIADSTNPHDSLENLAILRKHRDRL